MFYIFAWLLICLLVGVISLPFIFLLKRRQIKKNEAEAESLKKILAEAKRTDDFEKQVEIAYFGDSEQRFRSYPITC